MQETEGKRASVDKGAIEGDQSGEVGRAPPDAPAQKSRSVLVWALTLAGVCLVGAGLALAAVGLPAPAYPGLTAHSVIPTPLLLLGGLICARKPQERMGKVLLALVWLAARSSPQVSTPPIRSWSERPDGGLPSDHGLSVG